MNNPGFFKLDQDGNFFRAGKFVYGPGFSLLIVDKDTYTYPVDGWVFYEDDETARAALGLDIDYPMTE